MTLRQAVAIFPRLWIDGSVSMQEWLLACAVIEAALGRDDLKLVAEKGRQP